MYNVVKFQSAMKDMKRNGPDGSLEGYFLGMNAGAQKEHRYQEDNFIEQIPTSPLHSE